jgi:hypothetical protein
VGPLGCPVVHRTGPIDCQVRQLRGSDSGAHCSTLNAVAVDRCARSSRCSVGTPDSPVRQTRVPLGCLLLSLFEPFLGLFIGLC